MARPLKVGAVMYDPKVSVIWEIIRDFFDAQGAPIDVAFYSTYEDQNDGLLSGAIDIAWNSPLAWVDAQRRSGNGCRAIAMRDTDRDRISYFVARRSGPVQTLADLKGRTIATGAIDSPQATLIPLGRLRREGLSPGVDVTVRRFDVLVGKHGDHVGGERDALACLTKGDAEACAMLDLNWEGWIKDGTIDANEFRIVGETDRFDHCVFTVRQDLDPAVEKSWLDALFAMRYDNPAHREMMDLEGLKAWLPGRTTGFGPLTAAVETERFFARGLVVSLPLFPVTTVGSWPRPPRVAEAMRAYRHRRIDRAERDRVADEAVVELLRLQETLGCDIVTDGELRRDNFYSFVADKLSGVRLMTLAEMLEVVEDKAGFEQLLQTLDVPAYSISSPVCTARIDPARAADGRRPGVRAPPHRPADQGHAARTLSPDPRDVRSGIDARVLRGQRGARKRRRRAPPRGARGAAIGRRGVRPVRRAGPDGGRLRTRPDADVHVRGARRAEGSGRGARVRRLVDQRGGRRDRSTFGSGCTSAAATGAATRRRS